MAVRPVQPLLLQSLDQGRRTLVVVQRVVASHDCACYRFNSRNRTWEGNMAKAPTQGPSVVAWLMSMGVLALLPFTPIAVALFLPNRVNVIRMMGAGTLVFSFYVILAGLVCITYGFASLYVKSTGKTDAELSGFMIVAKFITTNQAITFVMAGILSFAIAGYVMTHSKVVEGPVWKSSNGSGTTGKDAPTDAEAPDFSKLDEKDAASTSTQKPTAAPNP